MISGHNIQKSVLNRFSRLLRSGRLAHAYLFAGPSGIGKSETAYAVAQLVNCVSQINGEIEQACGLCPSCVKINSGNHPDILTLDCGDSDSIKIIQVRELIGRLQMRSFEAAFKVCVIKDIEKMTAEGANAFLKTLEEPSGNTLLLLTTSVPEENLKTVVSRCHLIKFYPLSVPVLSDVLNRQGGDAAESQVFGYFSEGCISQAIKLRDGGFLESKNEIIDRFVLRQADDAFLKNILSDKDKTRTALQVILSWFRDLLVLKAGGVSQHVCHFDRYDELSKLGPMYSGEKISAIIDEAIEALALLGENLNVKIPLIVLREKIWAR